jgi:O-antigen ligase
MSDSPRSASQVASIPSFAGRFDDVASTIGGAAVVGTYAATSGLVRWAVNTDRWIIFFLVSKPLFDLTWRWEFFNIFNQRVNPQAIVGVLVTVLNLLVATLGYRKVLHSKRVLLFLGMATVSVIVTPSVGAVNELIRIFSGVSFFFTAGLALREKQKFDRFALGLLVVLCVPLVLSLLQVAGVLSFDYWDWIDGLEMGRASGTYQHPLEVVFFLVYAIPLALYRWENSGKGGVERVFLAIFFLLAFFGLAFTLHRAGWVAICIELGIWYALKKRLRRILLGALAIAVLAMVFSDQLSLIYDPSDIVPDQTSLETGHFLRGRGANWIVFLVSYANGGPLRWMIGQGGSVAEIGSMSIIAGSENEPHNDFIRILHAYGLVGLFLYLSLLVTFLREGLRSGKSRNPFFRSVGTIVVCSVVGVLFLSMTTEPMRYPTAVWYLFALGSALFWEKGRTSSWAMALSKRHASP